MYIKSVIGKLPVSVLISISEQLKLVAWAFGAINAYYKTQLKFGGLYVVVGWVVFQLMAHYIIYKVNHNKRG